MTEFISDYLFWLMLLCPIILTVIFNLVKQPGKMKQSVAGIFDFGKELFLTGILLVLVLARHENYIGILITVMISVTVLILNLISNYGYDLQKNEIKTSAIIIYDIIGFIFMLFVCLYLVKRVIV